ncbi:hypothetical protein AB0M48_32590 [Lentzea sp. NPDC051208]|uniref:hypothetical protein n=1 Tax=Lentzea sp. NPDC051208 TaxID=3154642 RepID=UPI003429081D
MDEQFAPSAQRRLHTETFLRAEYVETHAQVEKMADRFSVSRALALDEGASPGLIAGAVVSFSQQ